MAWAPLVVAGGDKAFRDRARRYRADLPKAVCPSIEGHPCGRPEPAHPAGVVGTARFPPGRPRVRIAPRADRPRLAARADPLRLPGALSGAGLATAWT